MSIDLAQFHQVFFEESFENLDSMEKELLALNVGEVDKNAIDTIFRAAHSIKGGSATFNFGAVAKFTHVLESLLEEMRAGKRSVTVEAVDLLLKSVDCLRVLLQAFQGGASTVDDRESQILIAAFAKITGTAPAAAETEAAGKSKTKKSKAKNKADTPADVDEMSSTSASELHTFWRIHFKPQHHILQSGNEPLRMFRQLENLGPLRVHCNASALPDLTEMAPEHCYLSWNIELDADAHIEQIRDVFEWVLDECELTIEHVSAADEVDIDDDDEVQARAPSGTSVSREISSQRGLSDNAQSGPVAAAANAGGASIRVGIDKVDSLINLVGELVITQSMLGQLGSNFDMTQMERLIAGLAQLEQNTRELQESVMRIRMLPISFTFSRFPRMVRDLAQQLGKKVELTLSGEHTELDKTLLEQISDPMVHLVRNSMDHGIEKTEIRLAAGKPDVGNVHLNAFHEGGKIVIEISDDGAGINKARVLAKALERGLINTSEGMSDEDIFALILEPGFSTADVVSDLSGRGVGMDVVKRNIKAMGGTIEINSEQGVGSLFTIRLPLTLAILDGQLVRVGSQIYIVPLISIIESLQIKLSEVNQLAGDTELYRLREDYVPIIRLYNEFDLRGAHEQLDGALLVVVEAEGQKIGVMVDDLLSQQQVVIKSLETNYKSIEGISGATILGDGSVALILDIVGLIRRTASRKSLRIEAA